MSRECDYCGQWTTADLTPIEEVAETRLKACPDCASEIAARDAARWCTAPGCVDGYVRLPAQVPETRRTRTVRCGVCG